MSTLVRALGIAVALLYASTTLAALPAATDGAIQLPLELMVHPQGPLTSDALAKQAAWSQFQQRSGAWDVTWNRWTGTPHRAFGPGIRVASAVTDADRATQLSEQFLRQEPVTKTRDLDIRSAATLRGPNGVWYANFHQFHDGLKVLQTDITVRLHENGKVMLFGSDARTDINLDTRPLLTAEDAQTRSREGLQFDFNADEVTGGEEMFILPIDDAGGTTYHLVRRTFVRQKSPPHAWKTYVDAHNGEVLWRYDLIRSGSAAGKIIGDVKLGGPLDPTVTVDFPHVRALVGGQFVDSNLTGDWSVSGIFGMQTARFRLEGPWANVDRQNASDAQVVIDVDANANPTDVDLHWDNTNSHFSERQVFYHTNVAHDYIKAIDPGFTGMDFVLGAAVMVLWDSCNARYDHMLDYMTFFGPDEECNNSAFLADIIYHEYAHGVSEKLYEYAGADGLHNGAFHEGMSDVVAAFAEDDPELGQGLRKAHNNGSRNVDNTNTWPVDFTGAIHYDGQIMGGAMWDLRERVGESVAGPLSHFCKYGVPDDPNYGIACQELFLEVLVADDDNGDLSDQTPHWDDIVESFNLHGIGPSLFLTLTHQPQEDTLDVGQPITISASLSNASTLFPIDASSVELVYSINGDVDQVVTMTDQGGGTYGAEVPGQPTGTIVTYYVSASNQGGLPIYSPVAPNAGRHNFLVGAGTQVAFDDFEVDAGWTVGAPGDAAITGIWVRVDPVPIVTSGGALSQPDDDHSPNGTQCWFTGNGFDPDDAGHDDVDEGTTTLLSPIFDASGLVNPTLRYFRWYSNDLGAEPGGDIWRVDISNDGGATWTSVENTNEASNAWVRILVRIGDLLTPTDNMRMRFIAEDADPQSLVEAGVDDWELLEFDDVTPVEIPGQHLPRAYALEQNQPNPFNPLTEIAFALPEAGNTKLTIYDLAGRRVRTLVNEDLAAGQHQVRWSGLDDAGASVASGIYIYRLTSGDFSQTKRMVLVK